MHAFLDFLKLFAASLGIVAVIFIGVLIGALLIELSLSRNDGHVSLAAGGLLTACAVDVWLMVRWPWLIAAWFSLFALIAVSYRWYGAWLRRQDAKRHRHIFDTLRDEESGFAVLACKCGAPYCLVRIVR